MAWRPAGTRVAVWIFSGEKKLTVAKQRWTPRTGNERQVEKGIGPSRELLNAILDMPEYGPVPRQSPKDKYLELLFHHGQWSVPCKLLYSGKKPSSVIDSSSRIKVGLLVNTHGSNAGTATMFETRRETLISLYRISSFEMIRQVLGWEKIARTSTRKTDIVGIAG